MYILRQNVPEKSKQKKNLNYVKMTSYSQRFLNYIKCQNVPILANCMHENHYSVKIDSISFFSSSDM